LLHRAPLRCEGMSSGELSLSAHELVRVSVALVDVDGVTRLENRAQVMCYAASIMKLAVAVAVVRKLDSGELSPDDLLAYNGEFASGFDGSPFTIDDDSVDPELFSVDPFYAQGLIGRDALSEHAGIGEFAKSGEVFPAHWLRKLPDLQSGLPVGLGPANGSRSGAEMGPVRSKLGPQSGLPVGLGLADGSLAAQAAPPSSGDNMVSVARALRRSITVSSNEAANLLMQVVGLEAVNWVLLEAGCDNSVVERMVFDVAARDAGRTNMLTALDAAQLMWSIRFGTIAADDSLTYLRQVLRCQTQRSMIPFAVENAIDRGEVVVGNKEGQTNEVLHDVAFIEPDDIDPFVLAVCTVGLAEAEATAAVRKVATYAYQHRCSWKSLSDNFR
jgi:beta-lactamase class A